MSNNTTKGGVWFAAAEPVVFNIRNNDTGKYECVTGCRVCVIRYDDTGVRDMAVLKATSDFADFAAKNLGTRFDGKAVACDTRGRACTLFDV